MLVTDLMYVNQNNKHVLLVQGESRPGGHWLLHAGKVVTYSVLAIVSMVVINLVIKVGIKIQDYFIVSSQKWNVWLNVYVSVHVC